MVDFIRELVKAVMMTAVLVPLGTGSPLAMGETTFLANYDDTGATGNARFNPNYKVGSTGSVATKNTALNETVDTPAGNGTTPGLITSTCISSGATVLDIHCGRDGVYYTALSNGNINRGAGTAEAFFQTPYDLSANTEPRAFFSGLVPFSIPASTRWYWQLTAESASPTQMTLTFGDSSYSPAKTVTLVTNPFAPGVWNANVWHHVVVTWQASNGGLSNGVIQLFVDGKLMATTTTADLPANLGAIETTNGNYIFIGMTYDNTGTTNSGQGKNLEGYVDSVRFDNTVLYNGTGSSVGSPVFTPPVGQKWRLLRPFTDDNAAGWGSGVTATTFDNRTRGFTFSGDMGAVPNGDRLNWDRSLSPTLNLSTMTNFAGWVYVTNAAAIKTMGFYFRSGGNWSYYSACTASLSDIGLITEGWNNFGVDKTDMGGTVDWNGVDMIRFSIWKQDNATGQVTAALYDMSDMANSLTTGAYRAFEYPEYDLTLSPRLERRDPGTNKLLESRVMLDESNHFITPQSATEVLDKITQAGYNVYMPCVWHGSGTIYRPQTPKAGLDPYWAPYFQGGADPLADLITAAHARNVQVHAWFTITLQAGSSFWPQYHETGTPTDFFEVHNTNFRDDIVNEIVAFVRYYNVDGINLDYVRTGGISTSATAQSAYDAWCSVNAPGHNRSELFNQYGDNITRIYRWQADAVSDIVHRVHDQIKAIKPQLVITTDGEPRQTGSYRYDGRTEWLWVQNDWIDVAYDMAYYQVPDFIALDLARRSSPYPDRFAVMLNNGWDVNTMIRQTEYFLRKFPDRGIATYYYPNLNTAQTAALSTGIFQPEALPYFRVPNVTGNVVLKDYAGTVAGLPVTVQLKRGGAVVRTDNLTLDNAGGFTISAVAVGTYDVRVKASHWLASLTINVGVGAGDVNMGTVTLTNGDANGDNAVTAADLSAVLAAIDMPGDAMTDLDGDSEANSSDLSIILVNMGQTGN